MVKMTNEEKAAVKQAKIDAKNVEKQQKAEVKAAEKQALLDAKAAEKQAKQQRLEEDADIRVAGYNAGFAAAEKATAKAVKDAIAEVRKNSDLEIKALKDEHKQALKAAVAESAQKEREKCALSLQGELRRALLGVAKELREILKVKVDKEALQQVADYVTTIKTTWGAK